jgi:hypothetical protein
MGSGREDMKTSLCPKGRFKALKLHVLAITTIIHAFPGTEIGTFVRVFPGAVSG